MRGLSFRPYTMKTPALLLTMRYAGHSPAKLATMAWALAPVGAVTLFPAPTFEDAPNPDPLGRPILVEHPHALYPAPQIFGEWFGCL